MQTLNRMLAQPKSEEEMDEVHQVVVETLVNFASDPTLKQYMLLYLCRSLLFVHSSSLLPSSLSLCLSSPLLSSPPFFSVTYRRYEGELLHLILLESVVSDSVANILSTLATI